MLNEYKTQHHKDEVSRSQKLKQTLNYNDEGEDRFRGI